MFRRVAASAVLSLSLFGAVATPAAAGNFSAFQKIHARTAISVWTMDAGSTTGQLVLDLFDDKDQFGPGKPNRVYAVLVSGSLSFCDSATNEQVTRDFSVFAPIDKKAVRFDELDGASVSSWVTLTGSEMRLADCNAPDASNPVFGSFAVAVWVNLTWVGTGAIQQASQTCSPKLCHSMTAFRFATAGGWLASDAPEMNMSLDTPSIAALSLQTSVSIQKAG